MRKLIWPLAGLGLFVAVLIQSPLVSAAETEYRIIPYLWTAGIDAEIGPPRRTIDVEVDFDDYVEFIDTGAAFIFDAVGEKWSFIANVMYIELSEDIDFPAEVAIDVESKQSVFEFGVGYRPEGFDNIRLLGGARYVELENTIDFTRIRDYNRERDGWDPFIGLEWRPRRGNWEYYVQGDIGGGNTVDSARQVALGTSYHFSEKYAFSAGYRYLDIDHDDNNFVFDGKPGRYSDRANVQNMSSLPD